MINKNDIRQKELFEIDENDLLERAIYEAKKSSPRYKHGSLSYYKNLDESLKSNHSICGNILSKNGMALEFVPDVIKNDKSLVLVAISNDIRASKFISTSLKEDEKIVRQAIRKNPFYTFINFPNTILNQKTTIDLLCKHFLMLRTNQDYLTTKGIDNISTKDIINVMIKILSSPFRDSFSSNSQFSKIIEKFVSLNGKIFLMLPDDLKKNEDLILRAIKARNSAQPLIIKYLPRGYEIGDLFYEKMLEAGAEFRTFPQQIKNKLNFCRIAIKKRPANAKWIGVKLWKNRELALLYLNKLTENYLGQTIFNIIEELYPDDEEIAYLIVSNGGNLIHINKFLGNKKIVDLLLENTYRYTSAYHHKNQLSLKVLYEKISTNLKKDKDIAYTAMKMDFSLYDSIDKSLKGDEELLTRLINHSPDLFGRFDKKFQDNKNLALVAINRKLGNYSYVSPRLHNDKTIIDSALKKSVNIFPELPQKCRENINIATMVVKENHSLIKHVGKNVLNNKDFISNAISCGASLKFASKSLKKDKALVKFAVEQYNSNLFFADKALKEDKSFLLNNFPLYLVFIHCSFKILKDKEIFAAGLNLDTRLVQRRRMTLKQILKMNYEGISSIQRLKIYKYYKEISPKADIFLLANAKSIICGT